MPEIFVPRENPLNKPDFWLKGVSLEEGMYASGKEDGMTFQMQLEKIKSEKTGTESPYFGMTASEVFFEKKRLREQGKQVPLTAVDECFKYAGIPVSGARAAKVNKVYEYAGIDVVFPAWVGDRIYAGMMLNSLVPYLVTEQIDINALSYQKPYLEDTEADRDLGEIGQGEQMGETKIVIGEHTVYLTKFGRYISVTYEALAMQYLNFFATFLRRVGQQIDLRRTDRLLYIAQNGDGNSNTPGTTVETAASGTIAVGDVIKWATGSPSPYKTKVFVGRKALLQEYATTIAGMANPQVQFQASGISLPVAYEWDRDVIGADNFVGFDSDYAMTHLTNGGIMVETDKIIRKQINGTAVSHRDTFTVDDNQAITLFDETH
jgi:hypothetical protein